MRVRIVCYEDVDGWILGKFAKKLNEQLLALSIDSDISKEPDYKADINHHIIYCNYDGKKTTIDTVMVTHIDSLLKINQLRHQLQNAEMGICMSESTMNMLKGANLPENKLCFINPAHDGVIKPRTIVLGITSKTHSDGRKKENILEKITKVIKPEEFSFKIMGSGWHEIVDLLRERGFSVDYYDNFDYDTYVKLVPTFDYYLYFSDDEGSMGFIDALAAGVQTIVTPQGYHLDAEGGISYPIKDYHDLIDTLEAIALPKRKLIDSVASWTWENYARKHIEVWEYLISNKENNHRQNPFVSKEGAVSASYGPVTSGIGMKLKIYFKLFKSTSFYAVKKLRKVLKKNQE